MSMPPWDEEIEMFDDPWWTWENVLVLVWRVFVIGWFVSFVGFLVGLVLKEWK